MKKTVFLLILLVLIVSCNDQNSNQFSVSGTIDGVRVGKLYLQRIQDTTLIDLDSVTFKGNSDFYLTTTIAQPELLYLHLDVKDGSPYNDRLLFFAEDTTMTINSTWDNFVKDAVISGSHNQDQLTTFHKNMLRLNETQTALLRRSLTLNSQENLDPVLKDSINSAYDRYIKKKVLYAINYAQLHKDLEVAPYILVSEASEANPVLLDSVYQKMPKKIQTTVYGKQLSELINNKKENL